MSRMFNYLKLIWPLNHVQLIIIALRQFNQTMAYRLRRYFVWKLEPTGTCANKVLEDDEILQFLGSLSLLL